MDSSAPKTTAEPGSGLALLAIGGITVTLVGGLLYYALQGAADQLKSLQRELYEMKRREALTDGDAQRAATFERLVGASAGRGSVLDLVWGQA